MLAEPLRDGWAVNKKWHDMIPAAGTNQTACQSLLTFTKTPERCRSPWWCCRRRRLSLLLCLFTYLSKKCVCVFTYFSIFTVIHFDSLSSPGFLVFARCFISIFGIKQSLLCCCFLLHCKFLLIFCWKSVLSFSVQLQWLLLRMLTSKLHLCLFKTKSSLPLHKRKKAECLEQQKIV